MPDAVGIEICLAQHVVQHQSTARDNLAAALTIADR
jgi:hypothetical protein